MIYCIKIAEDSECAEKSPAEKGREIFFVKRKTAFGSKQYNQCEKECNQISEKTFLNRRQISGHANEHIHQCEEERRADNIDNSLLFFADG